jgi:hypothetical protein
LVLSLAIAPSAAWNTFRLHLTDLGHEIYAEGAQGCYRDLAHQRELYSLYLSGQGNLAAVPGTSNHGWGLAVDLATPTMRTLLDQYGAQFGWSKAWSDAPCVPLDTRILTRRGFVAHDEIRIGEETVGFDRATGRTAWTPILGSRVFPDARVRRYSTNRFAISCTDNHRWTYQRKGCLITEIGTLTEMPLQSRLVLAAPGAPGAGLPITTDEAALIGWAMTDGSIYRFQNTRGQRAFARIYQSKPVGVAAVDRLLGHFEHRRDPNYNGKCVMWYVGRRVFSPILHRSRLDELGPVRFVLEMSHPQRAAWLGAVRTAEGTQPYMHEIAQSESDRREAIAIAAFLEGYAITFRPKAVHLQSSHPFRNYFEPEDLERQDVWCPTTGLGTWSAEQDGHVFLTQNSEWWHIKYREGVWRPRPNPGISNLYPILTIGSGGPGQATHVQELQRCLHHHLGRWAKTPSRDYGEFTRATIHALRVFQRDSKIPVTGVADPRTWQALRR